MVSWVCPRALSGPSEILACNKVLQKVLLSALPKEAVSVLCEGVLTCMTTLGGMRKVTSASSFEDEDEDESSFPASPSAGNESFSFSDLNVAAASWKIVSSPCCRNKASLRSTIHSQAALNLFSMTDTL